MADSNIQSPQIPDPIQQVQEILQQIQDVSLIRKYALWLAKKHPDQAVDVRARVFVVYMFWALTANADSDRPWIRHQGQIR